MGRRRDTDFLGPAGNCNVCGRSCCTLCQVGIKCYHCGEGEFLGRSAWTWYLCPACLRKPDPFCEFCRGRDVVPVARE